METTQKATHTAAAAILNNNKTTQRELTMQAKNTKETALINMGTNEGVTNTLEKIDANKAIIKDLRADNKLLVSGVINEINSDIKSLNGSYFDTLSKREKAMFLKKYRYQNKSDIVNAVLTAVILGLSINPNISLNAIKKINTLVTKGLLTRNAVNNCKDKGEVMALLKSTK